MAIDVRLQAFEGPLDLLLHLIEKNKIDIYDIPIAEITDQYMEYVRTLDHEDMEVTSEFMVMAATLIDIKCRMLLPREKNDEGEEEDPRGELVRQLLEYKEYRYIASRLRDRMEEVGDVVTRPQQIPEEVRKYRSPVSAEQLLEGVTLDRLQNVFQFVLQRQEDRVDPVRSRFGHIEKETVTLPEKLRFVEQYAAQNARFSFRNLLEQQDDKMQIIMTFLAVLELMKAGKIRAGQKKIFGDIEIESRIKA